MKLYQIVEIAGNDNHAGTKATSDIAWIAENIGFKPVSIRSVLLRCQSSQTPAAGRLSEGLASGMQDD